ncbi:MEDS domain-containing protein [Nitrososphaera sp.]|uniref:MEDS domain-containing protein n=1 Tax=Nitrososphaera sp. TaxID=1971748 RepID=UPI00307EDE23
MLVYDSIASFRRVYSSFASLYLPEDEIVLLATQYEPIEHVRNNLARTGVEVEKHLRQGTLFIVDAQRGYFSGDILGIYKLALSLASRAQKEGRRDVTCLSDMGAFFNLEKIEDMMDYELVRPPKFDNVMMKTVCCYHAEDFETLPAGQKQILLDHHHRSILIG